MLKIDEMDIETLKLHLSDLEQLRKYSRSEQEKGELTGEINIVKDRIKKLEAVELPKTPVVDKEAPVRADHNYSKELQRGEVKLSEDSKIGTIIL